MTAADRPKRALIRRDLRERYNKSGKTIKRWEDSGWLPRPDFVVNKVAHWWETTIEQNEQRLAPQGSAERDVPCDGTKGATKAERRTAREPEKARGAK